MDIEKFEAKFSITFTDKSLLRQAFTHSSYVNEHRKKEMDDNERLEFLGDAVLELGISQHLYKTYPLMSEGEMTKLRASIVCEESLFHFSQLLEFNEYILLGRGEERTGGRSRQALLADVFEAFLGALYIDQDYDIVMRFLDNHVIPNIKSDAFSHVMDYKSKLQEIVQRQKGAILNYSIVEERGPSHDKEFVAEVRINNNQVTIGIGRTKKEAEQRAAMEMLETLS